MDDSTEDVSKELKKIMELSEGSDNYEDAAMNEFLKRPIGLSIGIPPPSPPVSAAVGGVNVRGGLNSTAGDVPSSSPRLQRPNAARSRDRSSSSSKDNQPNEPTAPMKSSAPLSISVGGTAPETNVVSIKPLDKGAAHQSDPNKEAQMLTTQHTQTVESLKKSHEDGLTKLRQQFDRELEDVKKSLVIQNEASLDVFRKKLASEQLSDEKQLRAQKETFLSELRSRLKEEGDEEEAKLMEAKQDAIRKLKQQVSLFCMR